MKKLDNNSPEILEKGSLIENLDKKEMKGLAKGLVELYKKNKQNEAKEKSSLKEEK